MNTSALNTAAVAYQRRSVSLIMLHVLAALLPGIALYTLLIDSRLPGNLVLASVAALFFEAVLVAMRKRPVISCLKDASIVVAAVLLVLSVPQSLPVWQLLFGVFILCTLGKHVFGGLGHNPFNPAMVAYAVLIVSFPLSMTQWTTKLGFLDTRSSLNDSIDASQLYDWNSISSATPLDRLDTLKRSAKDSQANTGSKNELTINGGVDTGTDTDEKSASEAESGEGTKASASSMVLGSDWAWLSGAWLLGGLYLLFMRIISWQIPISVLGTLWILYAIHGLGASAEVIPASVALLSGAIMLGAFFIATDPVSSATSNPGKLLYGVGIGALCFVIREFSDYPEGFAFAVLLMNICVPLIDHGFTRNRISTSALQRNDEPPA